MIWLPTKAELALRFREESHAVILARMTQAHSGKIFAAALSQLNASMRANLKTGSMRKRGSSDYFRARPILKGVEYFDAGFFGMQPVEAALTDPQHRVFLECSWEALEDAGYDPSQYGSRIGVFAGCSTSTYFLNNVCADRSAVEEYVSQFQVGCYRLLGALTDFLSTRVAYKLNLRGPAITLHTACSTSLSQSFRPARACSSIRRTWPLRAAPR